MKHQFDYSISIVVKDQFGMDVYSANTNPDDLQATMQEMEQEIEQYDKDLGYVAEDQLPPVKEEEPEEELEGEQPVTVFIQPPKKKSTVYERMSIKAKAH